MRYMIVVKANEESEAGVMPSEELVAEMGAYHEELAHAGLLVDGQGLRDSSQGWRIRYSGDSRTVINGPFELTKDLMAGYTLIEVNSPEEALAWSKRYPNPMGGGRECEIEVRRLFSEEDFAAEMGRAPGGD